MLLFNKMSMLETFLGYNFLAELVMKCFVSVILNIVYVDGFMRRDNGHLEKLDRKIKVSGRWERFRNNHAIKELQ